MFDVDEMVTCEQCGTEQAWEEALIGPLGNRVHFRCRQCGWDWSEEVEDDE